MRFAFVSDIHGNLAALEAVIADLENRQVDQVVNLGDTLSGPLLPAETAQRLQKLAWLHARHNAASKSGGSATKRGLRRTSAVGDPGISRGAKAKNPAWCGALSA